MAAEHRLRRYIRPNLRKDRTAAWNPGACGLGQVESVGQRQKKAKHVRSADDRDRTGLDPECRDRFLKRGASRVPEQSVGLRGIGRDRRRAMRHDEALAASGPRATLMGVTAVHDNRCAVELGLQEMLVGVVADRVRHHAVGIGNHPVGRYDGIAFNVVRSKHGGRTIAGEAGRVIARRGPRLILLGRSARRPGQSNFDVEVGFRLFGGRSARLATVLLPQQVLLLAGLILYVVGMV